MPRAKEGWGMDLDGGDAKRAWGGRQQVRFLEARGCLLKGRKRRASYISLECLALVDGEEEDDVFALGVCFGEDFGVVSLGGPDVLFCGWSVCCSTLSFFQSWMLGG
jgi:hypothetical protein